MRSYLITAVLTFLLCAGANSQNLFIKELRFNQSIIIADGSPASPNASVLISKLAEGNGKTPRSTSFRIEFEQVLKVNTREPNFVFEIQSGKLRLNGDIAYRGFDMSEELIPAELTFILRLKKPGGSFRDVSLTSAVMNAKPENSSYHQQDSINEFSSYDLLNHVFRFGNSNEFENKIKIIKNYYRSIAELDGGFQLLQSVNPEITDQFRNNQKNLILAEKQLNETEACHFENILPLLQNDPGRLLSKLNAYRSLLEQKRNIMGQVLSTLHLNFYDRGIYQLKKGNYSRAREFFHWSLEVNPLYSPSLFQLAVIDFRTGDFHETICKADDILYNLPTDPETRSMTFTLLNDVYAGYLDRGYQHYKKNNLYNALDEYESAKRICHKYTQVRCTEALKNGITLVKKGIYSEYLDEARNFSILNDFDRAESIAKEAVSYQFKNKEEIKDASEAMEVLYGIRQKRYDQLIQKAIRLTDQKMYDAALRSFQAADSLLITHDLAEMKDVRKYTLMAARPRIIELLYEGEYNVTNNNLEKARECYRRSGEVQNKYGLLDDKDIVKHTQTLRKNIFTQQCINVQNYADSCYNKGQSFEADSRYIEANQAYEAGHAYIRLHADCDLGADSLESALLQIRNAVTYLELMNTVKKNQEEGSYQAALENFQKASTYFSEMKVQRFGLEHNPDIFRFIREKGSTGLINYSGDWYREKGELENSLSMYKLLVDRNYDAKFLSGSLYKLGLRLGQRDKKLNPGSSWKELVKEYTGGDKKLKRLAKGYKSGFKG